MSIIDKHLKVSPEHVLCCASVGSTFDSTDQRTWVTCPKCQQIIKSCHPGMDLTRLFANPRIT